MLQSALLPTSLFQDVITDLSYSYYGTSLAVACADHRVRIFTLSPSLSHYAPLPNGHSNAPGEGSAGGWELDDEFKAHDAPLTRVCYAHPAYGPILATAAFDRTVKIWEDVPSRAASSQRTRWVERKVLPDLGASVRSLEWAPEPLGLKLAGVGADGWVRIWECLDLPLLSTWEAKEEVDMLALLGAPGSGGLTPSGEKEPAPALPQQVGRELQRAERPGQYRSGSGSGAQGEKETDGGWAVAWCAERWWGDVLAVCCGQAGVVKIMQFPGSTARPITLATLHPPVPPLPAAPSLPTLTAPAPPRRRHPDSHSHSPLPDDPPSPPVVPLTSVAWAPACGRSFHLIAAGSEAGGVFLWKVAPRTREGTEEEGGWQGGVELVGEFEEHGGRPVGRVQFNPTGTILSSAGDDGRVRLWKASFTGVWRAMGSVYATPGGEEEDEMMDEDGEGEGYES
ncbi:WD40 repeat-like protein [Calocera viscosa TUFC12733]|uniref:WD40 repeat-like protein n=1 Tax=Calocera viscosa (strain TUFC12733) TaxID=1330018 RepID=A0A167IDV1_CALVF|nr:WD40 repeat-like protein [Calocera viscosa TUFC12733]